MELSPSSPNVGYFLLYPVAWWEEDPHLGDSSVITRASASAIVADLTSIATADIYGFDWVPDSVPLEESPPDNPVTWTNYTPSFFPDSTPGPDQKTRHPSISFQNYGTYEAPIYKASEISWFSGFAFGGTDVVTAPDGGANALLVEITTAESTDLARIGVGNYIPEDFWIRCSASSDGGQGFSLLTNESGLVSDFDEVFTRIKVWRLPTRIWPVSPPEPSEFWTGFIGAREII